MRTSLHTPFQHVALALALLGNVNLVAAQSAPPPAPGQQLSAPPAPPQQAAPAPTAYPSAPPAQGAYAPPATATSPGYPAQQPGAYAQPQGAYVQPGAYPQATQYQQPPPGYVAYPNTAPLYQPAGQPAPYRPARPEKGLMIVGISILGGAYVLAMGIGGALLDGDTGVDGDGRDSCRQCKDVAPWLFLPVVGPFVGMSETRDGDFGLWFLGMTQVVGLGLTVGGIVKYKNSKRAADMQHPLSWSLPHDRKLTVDLSASNRFSGPQLKLNF